MNRITIQEFEQMVRDAKPSIEAAAARYGWAPKIYIHWTAGGYQSEFEDYHVNIDPDGSLETDLLNMAVKLNHTYMRNSGSIGVAADCALKAHDANDLGPCPPTAHQVESLARCIAAFCIAMEVPCDIYHVMTHGEAADNEDGENPGYESNGYPDGKYGPKHSVERWDFLVCYEGDEPGSGGDVLRGKAQYYIDNGYDA